MLLNRVLRINTEISTGRIPLHNQHALPVIQAGFTFHKRPFRSLTPGYPLRGWRDRYFGETQKTYICERTCYIDKQLFTFNTQEPYFG